MQTSGAELLSALESEASSENTCLCFTIGSLSYTVGIRWVSEVIRMEPIMMLPGLPNHILGAINLRGRVVPVFDMGLLFECPEGATSKRSVLLVLREEEVTIALRVDAIDAVQQIEEENLEPLGDIKLNSAQKELITNLVKEAHGFKLMLNPQKLLQGTDSSLGN